MNTMIFCGILLLFGFTYNLQPLSVTQRYSAKEIEREMDIKFDLRDQFKEKGNSGKYLKIFPEIQGTLP